MEKKKYMWFPTLAVLNNQVILVVLGIKLKGCPYRAPQN